MILVDTSVWISFLKRDNREIEFLLKRHLSKDRVYTVSAVFGELFQGTKNKREVSVLHTIWESLPKIEEEGLFIEAGILSNQHTLYAKGVGLIDSYILAACASQNLDLWTLDKKLQLAFEDILA